MCYDKDLKSRLQCLHRIFFRLSPGRFLISLITGKHRAQTGHKRGLTVRYHHHCKKGMERYRAALTRYPALYSVIQQYPALFGVIIVMMPVHASISLRVYIKYVFNTWHMMPVHAAISLRVYIKYVFNTWHMMPVHASISSSLY